MGWSAGLGWRHRSRRLVATDHPDHAARRRLCARGRPEPPSPGGSSSHEAHLSAFPNPCHGVTLAAIGLHEHCRRHRLTGKVKLVNTDATLTAPSRRRIRTIGALTASVLLALSLSTAPHAWAGDAINTYDVTGSVAADGTLTLVETMTFDGDAPAQFVQRLDTQDNSDDYTYFQSEISNVTARVDGSDLPTEVTHDGQFVVITVDTSSVGAKPLSVGYDVTGAAHSGGVASGGTAITTVTWPVLQGLSLPVTTATGTITVPGAIRSVDCKSGTTTSPQPCQMWGGGTYDSPSPNFQDAGLDAGQVIIFSFNVPTATVAVNENLLARWTLDHAFSFDMTSLLVALGALIVGGAVLFVLWRVRGRDATSVKDPTLVAAFEPTGKGTVKFDVHDEIRPGHVGTVVDEHVDPIDITASVLDLAVRGHLCIVQLPPPHPNAPLDWTFERLQGQDTLRPFEQTLLDVIAPQNGPAPVVSSIGRPVEQVIAQVQDQLYQDVVDRGWFSRRPNQTRHFFDLVGWLGLGLGIVALVLLAGLTHFGLLGLALVALGAGLRSLARTMPRRTSSGVDLLHGLHALSMALQTQPTDQVPQLTAYTEISRILPYAVVLGGQARWVQALADADADPGVPDPEDLTWYHAPADWHLQHLPACLDAFVANMSGRLVSRN